MKKILKHKKKIILILIFIIIIASLIGLKLSINNRNIKNITIEPQEETLKENAEVETEPLKEEIKEEIEEQKIIYYVDVKGAVVNPGVYSLEKGKRVKDAIDLAGGLTEKSDTSLINLAKIIWDEMVIVIYTKDEVIRSNTKFELNTKINDAYYSKTNNSATQTTTSNSATTNTSNSSSNQTSSNDSNEKTESTTTININTASLEELMTLSGIGGSKAQAIIDYREEHGNFSTIEDIMNVSGIGEKAYEKIKEYITV